MANTLGILNYTAVNLLGEALADVTVAVLVGTLANVVTTTQPGSTLATLFSDPAGTTPVSNPTTTDGLGNISVCPPASGTYYVLQVYGAGIDGQQVVQVYVPHP